MEVIVLLWLVLTCFHPPIAHYEFPLGAVFTRTQKKNDNAFQLEEVGLTIGRGVYFSTESKNYIYFTPNAVANAPQFS